MAEQLDTALQSTRGMRRVLVALIFVAVSLNYVDRQVLALLKPTLEAEFGWSDQEFAHLGSVFQIAAAAALLFVGWFVDKVGVRWALGLGVAVWSAAGMAHAFAGTVQQFVVARAALAAAESIGTPAAVKAGAVYLPLKERSLGLGLFNTAPNIGAILTPLLIPPLALIWGWRAAFLVTGGLGFVWLIFWWLGTRNLKPVATTTSAAQDAHETRWSVLLTDRRSWAVAGAKALTDQVWWFVLFWMPDFFHRQFGMAQADLGYPIAIIFTLAALGALSSGLLFPRLLDRGLSVNAARKTSMLFYATLILPMALALYTTSPWIAAGLIGLALFAHQGFSTNIFGLTADVVPLPRVARVIALGAVCGNLTGAGIIELSGWSLTNGVGYWPMFAICSVAYFLATAWVHLLVPVVKPSHG